MISAAFKNDNPINISKDMEEVILLTFKLLDNKHYNKN